MSLTTNLKQSCVPLHGVKLLPLIFVLLIQPCKIVCNFLCIPTGPGVYNSPGMQSLLQQIASNPSLVQNMMQAPYMQSLMQHMASNPDMAQQVYLTFAIVEKECNPFNHYVHHTGLLYIDSSDRLQFLHEKNCHSSVMFDLHLPVG